MRGWLLTLAIAVPALAAPEVPAAHPGDRATLAITRALAYDRKLPNRAGDDVAIGLVHPAGDSTTAEAVMSVLAAIDDLSVRDIPVSLSTVPVADIERALTEDELGVLYLCGDIGEALPVLSSIAAQHQVLTVGFDRTLAEAGVPLAVTDTGDKLRIVVNLTASKAAGASFSSALLQVSDVIR
jgi:hypothetical protein